MKTQYYTATTLNGFIATDDDSLEWLFTLGNIGESSYPEFIADVGALAMGASTYEWMLRNADAVAAEVGSPWPYTQPVWIFTYRELPKVEGADIRFVQGDVVPVHAEMMVAAGGKNIWVVGGGDLAGQFYDAGLLDELIVQIGSATLGSGKPLFPRTALYPSMRLTSSRPMGDGMIELRYRVGDTITVERSSSNGQAIPILLSRSMRATLQFYDRLGFTGHGDDQYAILKRGTIELHFSLHAELVPERSDTMCYLRVENVDALYHELSAAQLPHSGIPRIDVLSDKPWGMREFAIVDEDGNLLRIGQTI
jgi:dihydrofolate reductase/catechol 2,3-dioxygenase-like lactoylglutathione lyase family enzyme